MLEPVTTLPPPAPLILAPFGATMPTSDLVRSQELAAFSANTRAIAQELALTNDICANPASSSPNPTNRVEVFNPGGGTIWVESTAANPAWLVVGRTRINTRLEHSDWYLRADGTCGKPGSSTVWNRRAFDAAMHEQSTCARRSRGVVKRIEWAEYPSCIVARVSDTHPWREMSGGHVNTIDNRLGLLPHFRMTVTSNEYMNDRSSNSASQYVIFDIPPLATKEQVDADIPKLILLMHELRYRPLTLTDPKIFGDVQ